MNHARAKRPVAVCLALTLAFGGLLSTACTSGSTVTTPTTDDPRPEPIAADAIRIISVDADSIDVEVVDPAMGGTYRLRIEGIQSDRPIYYINGVLAGNVFGNSADISATGARNGRQENFRPNSVAAAAAFAFSLWAAFEIIVYCGTPLYYALVAGVGNLLDQTWGECVNAGIDALTAKVFRTADAATELGKALNSVGVARFRNAIFKATGSGALDWQIIKAALTKQRFHSGVAVIEVLTKEALGKLVTAILEELSTLLFSETPSDPRPEPDPKPKPDPVPPPPPPPPPPPAPTPSVMSWVGSFTATGTFQLNASCVWSYVEEFSDVRLTILANGTGTLTAVVRTTEGPKISGPAQCPNNTYVRQQNDLFQLVVTGASGSWHFELAGNPIRTLRGTASTTTASGTYTLSTGAIGAGGVRQARSDFSLNRQ